MTDKIESAESLVLDPVAMNIVNRIAPGTQASGAWTCAGGLMLQGKFEGDLIVTGGPFVLMPEGSFSGNLQCDHDLYLSGTVLPKATGELSEIEGAGAAFFAETLDAKANITAGAFKTYEGSQVEGHIRTVRRKVAKVSPVKN